MSQALRTARRTLAASLTSLETFEAVEPEWCAMRVFCMTSCPNQACDARARGRSESGSSELTIIASGRHFPMLRASYLIAGEVCCLDISQPSTLCQCLHRVRDRAVRAR